MAVWVQQLELGQIKLQEIAVVFGVGQLDPCVGPTTGVGTGVGPSVWELGLVWVQQYEAGLEWVELALVCVQQMEFTLMWVELALVVWVHDIGSLA